MTSVAIPHLLRSTRESPFPPDNEQASIASLVANASLAADTIESGDIDGLAVHLPRGTAIHLPNTLTSAAEVDIARQLHAVGLEPIPSLSVRDIASGRDLSWRITRLRNAARVCRVMVLDGEPAAAPGPYRDALDLITSGWLQEQSIVEIGLAARPHHVDQSQHQLNTLIRTVEAASQTGLRTWITTPLSFDINGTLNWLRRLRARECDAPVSIGIAGPSPVSKLLESAHLTHAAHAPRDLIEPLTAMNGALGLWTPHRWLRRLAAESTAETLGIVGAHFVALSEPQRTARWMAAASRGALRLVGDQGFVVDPS